MSQINRFVGLTLATAGVSVALISLKATAVEAANLFQNNDLLYWDTELTDPVNLTSDLCVPVVPDSCTDTAVFFEIGDVFTLSSPSVIEQVRWFGGYFYGDDRAVDTDNFSIRIFDLLNSIPLSVPSFEYDNAQVTRNLAAPGGLYLYTYSLNTPITLSTGSYLLSIVNNTPGDNDDWGWAKAAGFGTPFYRILLQQNDGSFAVVPWQPLSAEWSGKQSFAISGKAIPTPALLPGLIGMGLAALKKRRDEASRAA